MGSAEISIPGQHWRGGVDWTHVRESEPLDRRKRRMANSAPHESKEGSSTASKCLQEVQKLLDCAVAEEFDQPRCWKLLKELRNCVQKGGVQDFTLLTPADCAGPREKVEAKAPVERDEKPSETPGKEGGDP